MALQSFTVTIVSKTDSPFNIIENAPIEIRERLANGTSGGLSLIFSDSAGTIPITQSGATANSLGQFTYFAAAADYNAVFDNQGTPVTIAVDVGVTGGVLNARFDRLNPATLAILLDDTRIEIGDVLNVKEHTAGTGYGSGVWEAFDLLSFPVGAGILDVFDHDTLSLQVRLRTPDGVINMSQIGLLDLATSPAFDAEPVFNAARDRVSPTGGRGGVVILGERGKTYGYNDTLLCNNDMIFDVQGKLKALSSTSLECAIAGIAGADGFQILNPTIDCDSIPAEGGAYLRRNQTNAKIINLFVENAVHDKIKKGGRALNIEAGVNPVENGNRNAMVNRVTAKNCYNAVTVTGGDTTLQSPNNLIGTVISEECETVILAFGNEGVFPVTGDEFSYIIDNVIAINCGKSTTYSRDHGALSMDRGSNVIVNNFSLYNSPAYGNIGSIFMGDAHNVHLKNAVFEGLCTRLFLFTRFAEADSITGDVFETDKCSFDIKHIGTCTDIAASSLTADSKVRDTEIKAVTDTVTSGKPQTSQMAAKTSLYCDYRETDNNSRIIGIASKIGGTVQFSDFPNSELIMGRKLRLSTFTNNAAAVSGGLSVGDVYAVTGSDPRQMAVVF